MKNQYLYSENIFRKCVGDRQTTRNNLDIKKGQVILIRRGMGNETEKLVSFISKMTFL